MGTFVYFTDDQKLRANSADLVELLRRRGEKLIRSGREYRLASDHSVTVRGNEWFDHGDERGGHAVSFVRKHYGLSYPDAVLLLLGGEQGAAYPPAPERETEPQKPFVLPPSHSNMRRVYAYLMKRRHIDQEIISTFSWAGLLYEDAKYHNCVFVGTDENGIPRHAHKRSVNSVGEAFRMNVEGSLPQYSFHHIGTSDRLYVFEGPIDLLSFVTLYPMGWQDHSYVALCGTGSQAMLWILEQRPYIQNVALCVDNDKAGIKAARRLSQEVQDAGYRSDILLPALKDWNDDLCSAREIPRAGLEMEMR